MADEVEISVQPWVEIVEGLDPKRWSERDPAYEFSNARKFTDPRGE